MRSRLLPLLLLLAACCRRADAQATFRQLFRTQLEYGLAVGGISLGCALLAALLVVVIVLCVRLRRRKRREAKHALSASTSPSERSSNSRQHEPDSRQLAAESRQRAAADNKPMAMIALPAASPPNGRVSPVTSKASSQNLSDRRKLTGNGNGRSSSALRGGADAALFRQSSLLRPAPLGLARYPGDRASVAVSGSDTDGTAIRHGLTHTSPMQPLQAHTFLSQYNVSQQQQPAHLKRASYAEQKAKISSFEINDQVFAAASLPRREPRLPAPPLQEQPTRKHQLAPLPPSQRPEPVPKPKPKPKPKPEPEPEHEPEPESADAEGPSFPRPVPAHSQQTAQQQQLRRIPLGGGDDRRSNASTVLKQEALQAFDFLEGYE